MPADYTYGGWTTYASPPRQSTEYSSELFERYRREMERGVEAIRSRTVRTLEVNWEDELAVPTAVRSVLSKRETPKIRKVTPLSTLADKEREICQK